MDKEKLLSPWLDYKVEGRPNRKVFIKFAMDNYSSIWVVYDPDDTDYYNYHYGSYVGNISGSFIEHAVFHSLDEGKKICDEGLTKLGYSFLTQAQWDNYQLLM